MEEKKNTQNQLNIEVPEEIAEGKYSNFVIIGHSNSEFVLDFVQIMPGVPQAKVRSRVIMTPIHAKRMLAALRDNLEKFEAAFGEIKMNDVNPQVPPSFGPKGFA